MKLRPGPATDAAAIADLWFDSWISTKPEHSTVTRADLVERVGKEMTCRWEITVVEGDEGLLGFLALAPHEQRVDQLFIVPGAQRRGIGTQLLNLAKQRLVNGFWLSADAGNKVAASFYTKEGLTLKRVETSGANARAVYGFDP